MLKSQNKKIKIKEKSTLTLLVFFKLTRNSDNTMPLKNLAITAHFFN